MKKKFGGYWFNPEYNSPIVILRKLTEQSFGLDWMYKVYSAASHGGHVASNIFLEQPDEIDINPRSNPKGAKLAVIASCRYLLYICILRNKFEHLGLGKEYSKLWKQLNSFKSQIV